MTDGKVLEFTGVTKTFDGIAAVSDFTARVDPGFVTAFLGPNGAGKTTTLRILLGQLRANAGTATIGGKTFAQLSSPRRVVGWVSESPTFRARRTAVKHLSTVARQAGVPSSRVAEVLALVGLSEVADMRISGYSLGMTQRLAVAEAMIGDPGVLVLDEPANGLDPEGIRWMRLLMRRLADEGRTVLVSSHLLSEIQQVADRLLVISNGSLVFAGAIEDLEDASSQTVAVDSLDRAALSRALRDAGYEVELLRSGINVQGASAAEIGALAAQAGVALTTLQQRSPSLEDVFIQLVSGEYVPPMTAALPPTAGSADGAVADVSDGADAPGTDVSSDADVAGDAAPDVSDGADVAAADVSDDAASDVSDEADATTVDAEADRREDAEPNSEDAGPSPAEVGVTAAAGAAAGVGVAAIVTDATDEQPADADAGENADAAEADAEDAAPQGAADAEGETDADETASDETASDETASDETEDYAPAEYEAAGDEEDAEGDDAAAEAPERTAPEDAPIEDAPIEDAPFVADAPAPVPTWHIPAAPAPTTDADFEREVAEADAFLQAPAMDGDPGAAHAWDDEAPAAPEHVAESHEDWTPEGDDAEAPADAFAADSDPSEAPHDRHEGDEDAPRDDADSPDVLEEPDAVVEFDGGEDAEDAEAAPFAGGLPGSARLANLLAGGDEPVGGAAAFLGHDADEHEPGEPTIAIPTIDHLSTETVAVPMIGAEESTEEEDAAVVEGENEEGFSFDDILRGAGVDPVTYEGTEQPTEDDAD